MAVPLCILEKETRKPPQQTGIFVRPEADSYLDVQPRHPNEDVKRGVCTYCAGGGTTGGFCTISRVRWSSSSSKMRLGAMIEAAVPASTR
jgi:hypothetical protein